MRHKNLARLLSISCLAIPLWLTGCGEKDESSSSQTTAPNAESDPTPTPAPDGPVKDDSETPVKAANPVPIVKGGIEAQPLPSPAVENPGGPLFARLPANETGIEMVNPILPAHPQSYLYATAMGCGGVTVGDIDNDGRPDLYFTGGPVPNRLYRQVDSLVFEDITAQAGVDGKSHWGTGASLVDIDNDGDLDLYVCNFDSANLLYLNNGDGTFTENARKFGLAFVSAGHTPSFCDFDLDGDLDLYLMTNFYYDPRGKTEEPIVGMVNGKPQVLPKFKKYYGITAVKQGARPGEMSVEHDTVGQPDRFVRNNGNGTFTEIARSDANLGKGNAALWWDPDADGRPDLYVANDFKDPDRFFRARPNGSLVDSIKTGIPHTTWFSMGTDSADLNGDGLVDLMVADMSGTNHFKQKIGMGAMSDSAEFLTTAVPRQYMRNAVFINTGTARFQEAAYLSGLANSDWTWTVRLSDFDNDGRVDVFLTNGMAVNLNVSDNPAAVNALPGETEWAKHVRAGTGPLKEQNLAFRNQGDLQFEDVSTTWGLAHVGMSYAAVAADLDRDGDLELVVANLDEPVSIYRNDAPASRRAIVELRGTRSNKQGLGATVRVETASGEQVRFLTLSRGYMASGEAIVHFGLGSDQEIRKLSVHWPSGHRQVFENLKADHHFTITEPSEITKSPPPAKPKTLFAPLDSPLAKVAHREDPFDDFAVQPLLPSKLSQLGPGLAWGDVDGDGDDDLYLSGAKGSSGQLLRNDGDGNFAPLSGPWNDHGIAEDMGALFFDSDGDGDQDLYVVSGGVEVQPGAPMLQDRLYLNDGKGGFALSPDGLPDLRTSGGVVTACDYDADGDLDLFVGGRVIPGQYPLPPRSHLLRNEGGRFRDVTAEVAPALGNAGLVTSALWTDADSDGKSDLLVTYEWGPVMFFKNTGDKLDNQTQAAGLYQDWGWWNGIAGGDFDHDGDIDYALTNFGLNTKYHASREKPARLFYGDFEGTGKMHCVEAEYEGETLYPVRGRSCSSNAMPFLLDKFSTFREFALASLPEIYPTQRLQSSRQYAATTLQSGLLINEGNAKFSFQPLPRIAQIAPGFGVELRDIDGDSHLDLYLVQNFHSPQPETGHMDGGVSQLLMGDGTGKFTPIRPDASGLVVSGDAKSLTAPDLDGDGWPDFVIGVNNDKIMAFKNQAAAGCKPFTVRLQGKPGNPTGIGARVTLQLADATKQTAEVYAGGGYLSQNPARLTFGLGETGAVARVDVTWPDGKTSQLENPEGASVLISQPE